MEHKVYTIDNTNFLTLDGTSTTITVLRGHAYLFLVPILEDGSLGARHEITNYAEGGTFPNIPSTDKYHIILAGTIGTKVEAKPYPDPDYKEALESAQAFIIEKLNVENERYASRSIKRQQFSDEAFSKALDNIASVVRRKESARMLFEEADEPVVRAFKIVAHHSLNSTPRAVPGQTYESSKSGVQKFAKDNTIRVREVILRGNWFKEDNGHLLAFYKPDGVIDLSIKDDETLIPVALIKRFERTGYDMINPMDGTTVPITKFNVDRIHPIAFMTYKSMAEDKISIKSICKFIFTDIKVDIIRYVLIGFMCTLIGLISPVITRNFIDYVIPEAARSMAVQICLLVFLCNISSMIGGLAKYFANVRMETKADTDLEAAIMDRLLKLPVNFFKDYNSGDLAARIMAVSSIRKQIFSIVLTCFMNFIFSFVYLIQEFRFCSYFAKWGILFCIFPIAVSAIVCFISYKWEKLLVACQGKIQGMLLQFLHGLEKIVNSHSEKRVFSLWSGEYVRQTKIVYSIGLLNVVNALFSAVYPTIVSMIFYYLYSRGMRLNTIQGLTTGTFMAFLNAYGSFQSAVLAVSGALLQIRNVIPLSKRIKPILEALPEVQEKKPPIDNISGNIEISHLNFRYAPNLPLVLKDINMSVKAGEFIAVVGTSGAGKSTLLRMLLGFEKAETGSVFFDSIDVNEIDIGSLRRQMGVVLQNDTVLQGTILQNIIGSSGLKEEDAWQAATKVAFDKDIEEMPMGMFTMIPAGGQSLSGGQLQRLIIARAIIRNPAVLIFDEATSALDNVTQSVVRQSLDMLKVTRIIIAHRLSTIINADRIYVMKDGEIIETGTYEELISQKESYFAQLAKRQSYENDDDDDDEVEE